MSIMNDGFSTRIRFNLFPGLLPLRAKEKTVKPPGLDGGGPNDTSTMRNTRWRTFQPKSLITLTNMDATIAWDNLLYNTLPRNMNTNGIIQVRFPDAFAVEFYGYLDKFMPNPMKEGEQPTAELTVVPTNQDTDGVETPPNLIQA